MMRIVLILITIAVTLYSSSIPKYIVYNENSDEINQKALMKIQKAFGGEPYDIFEVLGDENQSMPVIIGVFLSQELLNNPAFDPKNFLEVQHNIPFKELDIPVQAKGIGLVTHEHKKAFERLFSYYIRYNEINIRKLTADELALIWAYIGWDIDEPIYLLEAGDKKIVLEFDKNGKDLIMIEDISSPCFKLGSGGVMTDCYCNKVVDSQLRVIKKSECRNEKRPANTSGGSIRTDHIALGSPDELIKDNITVEQMANLVLTIEYALSKIPLSNFAESGQVLVDISLQAVGRPVYSLAYQGNITPELMTRIDKKLQSLPVLNTRLESVKLQMIMNVGK